MASFATHRLANAATGMRAEVCAFGATLKRLVAPNGADVVLGLDHVTEVHISGLPRLTSLSPDPRTNPAVQCTLDSSHRLPPA